MNGNPTDPRYILRRVSEHLVSPTTGDRWFHKAIYGAFGLLTLSFGLFAATSNALWPALALVVLVAMVLAFLGWLVWESTHALKAEAAAGVEQAPLTPQDTAGCIAVGVGGLLVVSGGVLMLWLPALHGPWTTLLVPLALLLGLLCAAVWLRLRRQGGGVNSRQTERPDTRVS